MRSKSPSRGASVSLAISVAVMMDLGCAGRAVSGVDAVDAPDTAQLDAGDIDSPEASVLAESGTADASIDDSDSFDADPPGVIALNVVTITPAVGESWAGSLTIITGTDSSPHRTIRITLGDSVTGIYHCAARGGVYHEMITDSSDADVGVLNYTTQDSRASCTVEITRYDHVRGGRIAGTVNADLILAPGGAAGAPDEVVDGTFDVPIVSLQ